MPSFYPLRFMNLFGRRKKSIESPGHDGTDPPQRVYVAGWLLDTEHTGVIWAAPTPLVHDHPKPTSSKSAAQCPAVIEFDRRHFVIPAPIDLHYRFTKNAQGQLQLTNMAGPMGAVRSGALNQMVVVMPQNEWRHPARPVLQITTPYLFVSDDPLWINQFPPYLHYLAQPLPGIQLCGRFPIDVWPRLMMWAFEWHDPSRDLVLKRGQPWFYIRFETPSPAARVRLVEAEMTPQLRAYTNHITDVSTYVNQTFSLFKTARERRPDRLLKIKGKDSATTDNGQD